MKSQSNLPPGVTDAAIERAAGVRSHKNKHSGHPAGEFIPDYGHPYEHALVRQLVRKMAAAGFLCTKVNNGEEKIELLKGQKYLALRVVMNEVFAVDDSWIYFTKGGIEWWVRLINGNHEDMISDWVLQAAHPKEDTEFEAVINSVEVTYV